MKGSQFELHFSEKVISCTFWSAGQKVTLSDGGAYKHLLVPQEVPISKGDPAYKFSSEVVKKGGFFGQA